MSIFVQYYYSKYSQSADICDIFALRDWNESTFTAYQNEHEDIVKNLLNITLLITCVTKKRVGPLYVVCGHNNENTVQILLNKRPVKLQELFLFL